MASDRMAKATEGCAAGLGRPLRVMQVVEAMTGGTRRFVLDVATGLDPEEFRQHVVMSTRRDRFAAEDLAILEAAGVEATVLDMVRSLHPARDLAGFCALRRIIGEWHPDIVHAHSSKAGFLARAAIHYGHWPEKRPLALYSPHCFAFQACVGIVRQRFYLEIERLAASWTDCFVFISAGERRAALARGLTSEDKVHDLPLGVDVGQFAPNCGASREELGLPEGTLVGSVGDLRPQKAPGLLVEAFARVAVRFPRAHLVLVGDGPLRSAVIRRAARLGLASRVHLLGHRTDVHQILPHIELFVMTSAWEGLPYALLEALACRRAVVVPELDGVADLVAASGAGLTFQQSRTASLAAALEAALTLAPRERETWGAAGRAYVAECHSVGAMLKALGDLYREMITRG